MTEAAGKVYPGFASLPSQADLGPSDNFVSADSARAAAVAECYSTDTARPCRHNDRVSHSARSNAFDVNAYKARTRARARGGVRYRVARGASACLWHASQDVHASAALEAHRLTPSRWLPAGHSVGHGRGVRPAPSRRRAPSNTRRRAHVTYQHRQRRLPDRMRMWRRPPMARLLMFCAPQRCAPFPSPLAPHHAMCPLPAPSPGSATLGSARRML